MKKRFIALFVIFAMLVPLTPAVAADDTVPRPTVEEILSEYHQKAFEAEAAGETAASYSPRSGSSGKTLEQETVDTLNAAGYEAYNVTSENYDALEAQLQTDFADMGLDSDGSYIIAISGDDSAPASPGNGSRAIVPAPDWGGNGFSFTYNGTEYTMRYVTVASDANPSGMQVQSHYDIQPQYWLENTARNILNTALVSLADRASPRYMPFGTIASLLSDSITDSNYTEVPPGTITIDACSMWTYNFIQVWNVSDKTWDTSQCSEYVTSLAFCDGFVCDPVTKDPVRFQGEGYSTTSYSSIYFESEQRKLAAMKAYDHYTISFNLVSCIDFFLGSEEGDVIFDSQGDPLFTHRRSTSTTLPDSD